MTRKEIVDLLLEELAHKDVQLPQQSAETVSFRHELGMDSLDLAEYIARMEQRFQVAIADDEWQQLETLALAADYIEERVAP